MLFTEVHKSLQDEGCINQNVWYYIIYQGDSTNSTGYFAAWSSRKRTNVLKAIFTFLLAHNPLQNIFRLVYKIE